MWLLGVYFAVKTTLVDSRSRTGSYSIKVGATLRIKVGARLGCLMSSFSSCSILASQNLAAKRNGNNLEESKCSSGPTETELLYCPSGPQRFARNESLLHISMFVFWGGRYGGGRTDKWRRLPGWWWWEQRCMLTPAAGLLAAPRYGQTLATPNEAPRRLDSMFLLTLS